MRTPYPVAYGRSIFPVHVTEVVEWTTCRSQIPLKPRPHQGAAEKCAKPPRKQSPKPSKKCRVSQLSKQKC